MKFHRNAALHVKTMCHAQEWRVLLFISFFGFGSFCIFDVYSTSKFMQTNKMKFERLIAGTDRKREVYEPLPLHKLFWWLY